MLQHELEVLQKRLDQTAKANVPIPEEAIPDTALLLKERLEKAD
jgi:hypothetical protein